MESAVNTEKMIVKMIDVSDNGKVAYLEAALQTAATLLGAEWSDLVATCKAAHAKRTNSPTSVATLAKDLLAARYLVIKYGSAEAAGVAVNVRNEGAKRASYSPQYLQQELAPVAAKKKSTPSKAHVVVMVDDAATVEDLDRAIADLKARRAALVKGK